MDAPPRGVLPFMSNSPAPTEAKTIELDAASDPELDPTTEQDTASPLPSEPRPAAPAHHQGRYVLIDELGQGGMGVVWRAYDTTLQREVALKTLHADGLPTDMQLRLVREAQAMAKLSHPNVVAVYDVERHTTGVTLAMELVDGQTLSQWSRAEPRSVTEIVRAFVEAGRGLVAAHEAGLLHRDFKPANVLVSATGSIKVTDFGLARLAPDEPDRPSRSSTAPSSVSGSESNWDLTQSDVVMGTPAYMAPEQHEVGALTPAVDQYAFCASLWHTLTGALPFGTPGGGATDMRQLLHAKRAGAPAWPRTRSVFGRWVRAIRRGLAPVPEDRWPSMTALLDELAIDPERRRRWMFGLGALALVGAASWGWNHHTQHMATVECEAEGAAVAEIWSDADADAIAHAFDQTGLVHASDAWSRTAPLVDDWARDWAELRTRACLEHEREHTRDPDVLRRARACFDEQGAHLRTLVERWSAPTNTVVSAASQAAWDLPSPSECLDPLVLARLGVLDRADPRERADVQALRERLAQAEALHSMGHYEDAFDLSESVLRQAATQDVPPLVVAARLRIGKLHIEQGRFDEAQRALRTTFLEAEALGDDRRATTAAWTLAFTLGYHLARLDEARDWSELASAKQRRLGLDPDDPRIADALGRQATLAAIQRQPDEALALFTKAQGVTERALGPDHPNVGTSLNNLALAQFQAGDHDNAVVTYRRSTAIAERAFGPHHPSVAYPLNNIALVLRAQGHYGLALRAIERALEIREAALGPDHLDVASSLINLGTVYQALGRNEDLLETSIRALEIWEGIYGPEHPRVARQRYNTGLAYGLLDRPAEALEQFERAHASAQGMTDGDPELLFEYRVGMAQARLALGDADRAAQLLESSLRSAEDPRIDPQAQAHARFLWARSLSRLGERSQALEQARIAARSAREDERIDIEAWIAGGSE